MPDNQFNPGPYGSASTSYSSASGPNPQSAPSAATTWASPGQNAGILPPTNQKSLIGKPGLGLSVFWLVLGLITLAVGAGLASLNLTDATLPSLSSFSPGTSKSAQLEANRTYAFYAASTKLDSARKTSCVVSGPDGYSPTVTNANSSEELQLNRSYYKVATFSPNKSGSYSFACSNPNLDRADVFAIADITDTTTVTSSNDLIYARIFVGAGAFLGLVGLGLGIFGVIALIRKLKARRNFTDGLPAQGGDSASASSGAFNGYVPTTPGQAPLGFQAQGVASQGPDAAAASQWAAAGAGAAGTAAAAAPQWGAPQGQWAAQAQASQAQAFQAQSSPAAQSQASAQSSNSSAQAASAHSAPQAPNPYVTAQAQSGQNGQPAHPQANPYVTAQAQQAPASQPAQPQSYAQSAQPAQPQANPYITAQAQPGQNVQPGQPIEVYGQQATQPLNPYLTQPQPQAQAQAQAQASVAQSAAQAGTPAGTQVGTPAGAQAGAPATAQGNAQAGSPAGAQGQNAAGYWPVPNFAPSDQAAQPGQFGQPDQFGQTAQAPQGYGQVPQGYGQPVQPQANPYVTTQAQQAPASQTAQPQSYAQSAQPAQAPQVPQGYGQAQPGQNVQPGQPIEVYGQQATQPLNPYLTQPQPQPQPQTQPSVVPSAAQAPQGYGRPAQPGQGYGQVPQGYGQAQPVQPAQSVQQPAQVPGVSQLEHPNQPGRPTQPLQPTNDTRVIASPTDTTQVVFEPANPVSKTAASQPDASQQAGANEEVEETDQRPVDAMYTDPTRVISTTEAANRYN